MSHHGPPHLFEDADDEDADCLKGIQNAAVKCRFVLNRN
jgi:hypothetical protein